MSSSSYFFLVLKASLYPLPSSYAFQTSKWPICPSPIIGLRPMEKAGGRDNALKKRVSQKWVGMGARSKIQITHNRYLKGIFTSKGFSFCRNQAIWGSWLFFACWTHRKRLLHSELALFTICELLARWSRYVPSKFDCAGHNERYPYRSFVKNHAQNEH